MTDTPRTPLAERDRLAREARALLAGPGAPNGAVLPPALALRLHLACERLATKRMKLERSLAAVCASRRELRGARRTLEEEVGRARHALARPPRPSAEPHPHTPPASVSTPLHPRNTSHATQ